MRSNKSYWIKKIVNGTITDIIRFKKEDIPEFYGTVTTFNKDGSIAQDFFSGPKERTKLLRSITDRMSDYDIRYKDCTVKEAIDFIQVIILRLKDQMDEDGEKHDNLESVIFSAMMEELGGKRK